MELGVVEVEYSWMALELKVIENARLTIRCYSHLPMNHYGFLLEMLHVESVSDIENHKKLGLLEVFLLFEVNSNYS